jgi:hypothetical protein
LIGFLWKLGKDFKKIQMPFDRNGYLRLFGIGFRWLNRRQILLERVYFIVIFVIFQNVEATKELHIGSLFPMEAGSGGWAGGL